GSSQIAKTTQSLTKPYANWEEYLTPAPLSIAILGELVFISSKTDFSINKNPPKDGYKYIRYPDSFRACLMQVCNSGWGAFNEAHKNMDQIRLHTMTVPNYMKTAVKILFPGNDEFSNDCLDLAASTEKRFTDVINIIQELLEACVNAEHFYGEELEEIKKKLEENKIRKQSSEEAVKRSEKIAKAMEEEMKEAQESYKSAMDSIPSGWESMAMDLVAAFTESVSTVMTGMTSVVTQPMDKMCNATKTISETYKNITGNIASADEVDKINIYSKSAAILACAEVFQQFVHDSTIDWKSLYDQKKKLPIQILCKGSSQINSRLEQIQNVNQRSLLTPRVKMLQNPPSLTPKPPMMNKEESQSEKKSASQSIRECQETVRCWLKEWMRWEGEGAVGEDGAFLFHGGRNIVKTSLTRTLKDFISTSEKTQFSPYNHSSSPKICSTIKPFRPRTSPASFT
uniref:Uncharacterized protein n=1 Tax=Astyanax mexicanus TaxID=7994 RepID=A0A3B1IR91_ASTMX